MPWIPGTDIECTVYVDGQLLNNMYSRPTVHALEHVKLMSVWANQVCKFFG